MNEIKALLIILMLLCFSPLLAICFLISWLMDDDNNKEPD